MIAGGLTSRLPPRSDVGPVLAFDVGGTDIKSGLVLPGGDIVALRRTPTPKSPMMPEQEVVDVLARLKDEYVRDLPSATPHAIGLSIPGIVDEVSGIGIFSANLGWRDAPILELARSRLGLPVALGHDVHSAALAEFRHGAATGYNDVAFVVIGTGLSAAFVLDGRLYHGRGLVGELGHIEIEAGGDECSCGARGCLETIASATAIARRYEGRSGATLGAGGARSVVERAIGGDPIAQAVWGDATEALATGLAHVVSLLAPELIVLGGGLSGAGRELVDPVARVLDKRLAFQARPMIALSKFGGEAGLLGAALRAQELLANGASEL